MERLEDMLPWTHCMRIAHNWFLADGPSTNKVGNQAVGCPVASANHITCPCARYVRFPASEKCLPVRRCHDLGARLAAGVRVKSAQWLSFIVRFLRFPILVTLVGRNDDNCLNRIELSHRFENVQRSH